MRVAFTDKKIIFVPAGHIMKIFGKIRAIFNQNKIFTFQGCHIYDNLAGFELKGNPNQRSNIRFFIFMPKNLKIWNLFFMVLKKNMSGFPYLRRGYRKFDKKDIFKIPIK